MVMEDDIACRHFEQIARIIDGRAFPEDRTSDTRMFDEVSSTELFLITLKAVYLSPIY